MFDNTLHRIVYDATIDDAVDASFRLMNRTKAFRNQIQTNVTMAGVAAGLGFVGLWFYIGGGRTIWEFVVSVAVGIVFGFVFAFMFRGFLRKEIRKQHRRIISE